MTTAADLASLTASLAAQLARKPFDDGEPADVVAARTRAVALEARAAGFAWVKTEKAKKKQQAKATRTIGEALEAAAAALFSLDGDKPCTLLEVLEDNAHDEPTYTDVLALLDLPVGATRFVGFVSFTRIA